MSSYQLILLVTLIVWPIVCLALLFLMQRLEDYVKRLDARTPEEAGLEPISGAAPEREVRIRVGDRVIGEPEPEAPRAASPDVAPSA